MKKQFLVTITLLLTAGLTIWIGAATPTWIQYYERVVGENSPLFEDVVNRPMKEIWGNFTSQHTTSGGHKIDIFITPLPTITPVATVTPIPLSYGDLFFTVEHELDGTHPSSIFPTPIPTLPSPTPAPTATVIPETWGDLYFTVDHNNDGTHKSSIFPTPIPTAIFPTPLPTPTPAATTHFTDMTMHGKNLNVPVMLSTNQTIPYTYCYGQVLLLDGGSRTITLPVKADLDTYNAHTVTFVNTVASAQTILVNSGYTIIANGGLSWTNLTSQAVIGTAVTLRYLEGAGVWVVIATYNGAWTPS